jgi:NAD(P)-dependent dehydrogenase (short-subunit alcohol dehydrogenase family)
MADERPVTLITGAGTGIGLAAARLLSEAGHRIALTGRREPVLREAGGGLGEEGADWATLPADVSDPEQAGTLPTRVVEAMGRLDGLVNNAGWSPLKPVADHTPEDVANIFAVNATGAITLLIATLRVMQTAGRGRIVNVSSMASDDPFPGLTVYGAAKASLNTLTKGLANELGDGSPIRVFSVAPGAVETPLLRSLFGEDQLPREATLDPDAVGSVIADCVLGRRDGESGRTIWLPSP